MIHPYPMSSASAPVVVAKNPFRRTTTLSRRFGQRYPTATTVCETTTTTTTTTRCGARRVDDAEETPQFSMVSSSLNDEDARTTAVVARNKDGTRWRATRASTSGERGRTTTVAARGVVVASTSSRARPRPPPRLIVPVELTAWTTIAAQCGAAGLVTTLAFLARRTGKRRKARMDEVTRMRKEMRERFRRDAEVSVSMVDDVVIAEDVSYVSSESPPAPPAVESGEDRTMEEMVEPTITSSTKRNEDHDTTSYYPPGYDVPYPAVPWASRTDRIETKQRRRRDVSRAKRKEGRTKYFSLVSSRSHGSSATERDRVQRQFKDRVTAPSPMERLFDTGEGDANQSKALYGYAMRALWNERSVDALAGDGAFSDVFATNRKDSSTSLSPSFGPSDAVLKCSNPFPGVVNGRQVGEGYYMGAVEAKTLASIPPHPALVRIYAAFLEKNRNESYILLSSAGTDMHSMRERGELTPAQVRVSLRRALQGIAHCHSHGVVHRDIKAGNLLLKPTPRDARVKTDYRATLIDFGVAKQAMLPDEYACDVYGTPGYQAPETLLSDMDVDHEAYTKVDMFAFGATAYFLCTGKELFGAKDVGKPEAEAKVKKKVMAFWQSPDESDKEEESESDSAILASMLRFADMNMTPSHEARYRQLFGDSSAAMIVKSSETLRDYVFDAVAASQPAAFARLVAECVSYDPNRRPSARDALLSRDAWRGVSDDDDVEDHVWQGGGLEVCYLPSRSGKKT